MSEAGLERMRAKTIPARLMILLCCIGIATFAAETLIMGQFKATGAFAHHDILFDADPNTRLPAFAHGWPSHERLLPSLPNSLHPFLPYITSPAIRVLGKVSMIFAHGQWSEIEAREAMGLLVSPLCSGLSVIVLGVLLFWMGMPACLIFAGATLRAVSFSSLMFGAIPDHFALGGLAVTSLLAWLAYALAQDKPPSRLSFAAWALLAIIATGITVTHAAVAAIVLLIALMRRMGVVKSTLMSGALSFVILAGVLAAGVALALVQGIPAVDRSGVGVGPNPNETYLQAFVSFAPDAIGARVTRFAASSFQSLVSIGIHRVPSLYIPNGPDNLILPSFGEWSAGGAVINLVLAALFILAAALAFGRDQPPINRGLCVASLLVILANLMLHSVYGEVPFLYSEHWLSAVVIVYAVALSRIKTLGLVRIAIATGIVALIGLQNFHWVEETVSTAHDILATHGGT